MLFWKLGSVATEYPDTAQQQHCIAAGLIHPTNACACACLPACPQECGLLAALRHPNVVQFMGVSAMPPAMITEYCSRGSLADVLHAANRSSARAAQLTWARRLNLVSCQGWGLQGRGQGQEGHA
jgi:hypothetical protein